MNSNLMVLLLCMSLLIIFQSSTQAMINLLFQRRRIRMLEDMEIMRTRKIRRNLDMMLLLIVPKTRRRCLWKKPRSTEWWDVTVKTWTDEDWIENFRRRKGTFDFICNQVKVILSPDPFPAGPNPGLSVDKIVAIALYKLAHVGEYVMVANQFGVHKSTVHNCVYSFCFALTQIMSDQYIDMPSRDEAEEIATCFEEKTHIPQIIGAIDGSHIPITAPEEGLADYVNRKFYCSVVLQAIVDHQFLFRDVSCKLPGSCHDVDDLRQSNFYQNLDTFMPRGSKELDGMNIPFMILGDPAYPLKPWLLKNYTYDPNMSMQMDSFNVYMNKGRIVVENAFCRLKGRWRILLKRSDVNVVFVPTMVAACCILHNICEMSRDTFRNTWLNAVRESEEEYPPVIDDPLDVENNPEGVDIRDHLMLYLSRNFPILSSIRGRTAAE